MISEHEGYDDEEIHIQQILLKHIIIEIRLICFPKIKNEKFVIYGSVVVTHVFC